MKVWRKKAAEVINRRGSEIIDYVGGIGRDRYGSPSSKRWMAFLSFILLCFVVVYVLVNHKEYDVVIVLILTTTLLVLILVLMGYSSLAEKVVTGFTGLTTNERVIKEVPTEPLKPQVEEEEVHFTDKDFE